jgi:hypothetical protein
MMPHHVVLAVTLVWIGVTGPVRAQAPGAVLVPSSLPPAPYASPSASPAYGQSEAWVGAGGDVVPPGNPPLRQRLLGGPRQWGCWSHHNLFGCGSIKSDLTFMFGSCRTFFGEPCLSPPPTGSGPTNQPAGCHCP